MPKPKRRKPVDTRIKGFTAADFTGLRQDFTFDDVLDTILRAGPVKPKKPRKKRRTTPRR